MAATPDLIRAAIEVYALELQLANGLSTDALDKAISSAMEAHERAVVERIAAQADQIGTEMEAASDQDNPDFAVALQWFAWKLREENRPPEEPYEPADGDVVEVTITGEVFTFVDPDNRFDWLVVDDRTHDEYYFRTQPGRMPRVRVLTRNEVDNDADPEAARDDHSD